MSVPELADLEEDNEEEDFLTPAPLDEEVEKQENNTLTEDIINECISLLFRIGDSLSYVYIRLDCSNRELNSFNILEKYIHLRIVDISHNQFTDLSPLNFLPNLLFLKADRNSIEKIALEAHSYLQYISLGSNRIVDISEGLTHPIIKFIDISGNKIRDLSQLKGSPHLTTLKASSNLLEYIEKINIPSLTTLSLGFNKILHTEWISDLVNLEVLELNNNMIDDLEGFHSKLKQLKYIDLRENIIEEMSEVIKLSTLPSLTILFLNDTPVSREEEFRIDVLCSLRYLESLNNTEVTDEEKQDVEELLKPTDKSANDESP